MIILGVSCYYHDSSAAILKDGEIIAAAQEERFTRKKHDNSFPYFSIEFCLKSLNITIDQVDVITFYEKPIVKFERVLEQHIRYFPKSLKVFADTIPSWVNEKLKIKETFKKLGYRHKIIFIDHHYSHAAASFLTSPFQEAAILTLDGVGEYTTTATGFGNNCKITLDRKIDFPHSLGLFYSAITSFLGFEVNNDEYKIMGLAAYGTPNIFYKKIKSIIKQNKDGSYMLDMQYFAYEYSQKMFTPRLEEFLGTKARVPSESVEKVHQDIASATQKVLEETVFYILKKMHPKYKTDNLILSGGVALNSVLNGKILNKTPYKHLYITPDPGDGGNSLGSALYYWHSILGNKRNHPLASAYLGPEFNDKEALLVIKQYNLKYKKYRDSELNDRASDLLVKEKVIGWFQGKMEWGPRALGNRSILATTTRVEMRDIINAKVKHREMFRPFAPAILDDFVKDYFITDQNIPLCAEYMLTVYPFKASVKKKVPAVVHVDGTGRLQTVRKLANTKYYSLIDCYRKKTGIPLVLNTSFNVKGEPIVCTPEDAVKCFLNTEIDYLIINNFLIEK